MQAAAAIHDAARRLEEAAAVFRFKSRAVLEEYEEIGGHWTDSRARQFSLRHIQPQRESIDQGAKLCRVQAELMVAAQSAADAAERSLSAFYAAQADFEASASSTQHAAQAAQDLAARSSNDSSRVAGEVGGLNAAIAAASVDPGW